MERIASRKIHFAPLARQQRAIRRLLSRGRHRDLTDLMRAAIDHYLDWWDHPTLAEQARCMAEDFRARSADREEDPSWAQEPSRETKEPW